MKKNELLNLKLRLIDQIYDNTLEQANVIENKDEQALEKLLQLRQELMDKVDGINIALSQAEGTAEEEQRINKQIEEKLKLIYEQNKQNALKAEQYQEELRHEIYHMNQGKKALTDGYFKQYTQSNGYFIDQKIGK